MDFEDLKGRNGHCLMYSLSYGGQNQNIRWSFHAHKITAQISIFTFWVEIQKSVY